MKKKTASLALTASLLGGGVVGAATFGPTVAAAQDEDPAVEVEETQEEGEKHNRRGQRRMARLEHIAELTGIDADTWIEGFQDGKTSAEVAEENGLSRQELIDLLVADAEERITERVDRVPGERGQGTDE